MLRGWVGRRRSGLYLGLCREVAPHPPPPTCPIATTGGCWHWRRRAWRPRPSPRRPRHQRAPTMSTRPHRRWGGLPVCSPRPTRRRSTSRHHPASRWHPYPSSSTASAFLSKAPWASALSASPRIARRLPCGASCPQVGRRCKTSGRAAKRSLAPVGHRPQCRCLLLRRLPRPLPRRRPRICGHRPSPLLAWRLRVARRRSAPWWTRRPLVSMMTPSSAMPSTARSPTIPMMMSSQRPLLPTTMAVQRLLLLLPMSMSPPLSPCLHY